MTFSFPAVRIDVITDADAWAAMRSSWNELLGRSRADSIFLTWEWLHTWWTHLRDGRQLFIVSARCGDELVAVAPLAMRRSLAGSQRYEFLGSGSVGSDYLDFIIRDGFEPAAIEALIEFFRDSRVPLRLPAVKQDSAVAALLAPSLTGDAWRVRSVPMQVSPYIDLTGKTFDAYLGSIGASHRYNVRRRLRNLEKSHDVRFERVESDDGRRAALQHVIDLHLRRWSRRGGSDAFHRPALVAFHNEFSALAMQQGWLRLRLLTIDGKVAGAFYGLRYAGSYAFYQSGFDEAFAHYSAGLVTLGLTIREAIEEGAAEYDFLHGDESYKFLWARDVRPLSRLELYPPGLIGRVQRHSAEAIAATKKVVKRALHWSHP